MFALRVAGRTANTPVYRLFPIDTKFRFGSVTALLAFWPRTSVIQRIADRPWKRVEGAPSAEFGQSVTLLAAGLRGAGASVVGMHIGKRFALELNLYPVHKLRLKK